MIQGDSDPFIRLSEERQKDETEKQSGAKNKGRNLREVVGSHSGAETHSVHSQSDPTMPKISRSSGKWQLMVKNSDLIIVHDVALFDAVTLLPGMPQWLSALLDLIVRTHDKQLMLGYIIECEFSGCWKIWENIMMPELENFPFPFAFGYRYLSSGL
jgi:hypothetical protein